MNKLNEFQLKKYQLMILGEVDKFCKKNNIRYYLFSGTLIGAIRHSGYIPWDDDIDIMMFRSDYERFISLFNNNEKEYHAYSIKNDKGYNYHFSKISYEKTRLIENNICPNDIEIGVNIDLFPIDNIDKNINNSDILKKLHFLDQVMYCKSFRLNRLNQKTFKQKLLIVSFKLIFFFLSKKYLGHKQEKLAQQFNFKNSKYCSVITCHYKKKIPVWKKEWFEESSHLFEGKEYMIPKFYDEVLREQWGDYMKLPPESQRVTHHSFTAWEE